MGKKIIIPNADFSANAIDAQWTLLATEQRLAITNPEREDYATIKDYSSTAEISRCVFMSSLPMLYVPIGSTIQIKVVSKTTGSLQTDVLFSCCGYTISGTTTSANSPYRQHPSSSSYVTNGIYSWTNNSTVTYFIFNFTQTTSYTSSTPSFLASDYNVYVKIS